jgi:uncharacterized coiled-coil DUF342 family protein
MGTVKNSTAVDKFLTDLKRQNWRKLYLDALEELKAERACVDTLRADLDRLRDERDGEHQEVERLRAVRAELRARLDTEWTARLRAEGARDIMVGLLTKELAK